ncbi:MAG: glutathione S-transferase family protein [Sneathiella sp.]|nr:glutathione S-transferase family protein [Sneathiella sp.]
MIVAFEKGLQDKIELISPDLSDIFKGINPSNPLGKVPSLEIKGGDVLFDSIVICEYLDSLSDDTPLFATAAAERAKMMTLHAVANGLTDCAYQRRMDSAAMPKGEGSPSWNARLRVAMESSLDQLEKQASEFSGHVNIATIAIACALGYHDFRFSQENWKENRPNLTAWFDEFSKRPSFQATIPPEG